MPSPVRDKTYLRSDINRILRSLGQSNSRLIDISATSETELYHAGFISALIAVADAFGIDVTPEFHRLDSVYQQRIEDRTSIPRNRLSY